MSTQILLEAALRSLILGASIWAALRLLRIRQVRAQRTAWLLVLVGALAMPALVAWKIGPPLLPAPIFTLLDNSASHGDFALMPAPAPDSMPAMRDPLPASVQALPSPPRVTAAKGVMAASPLSSATLWAAAAGLYLMVAGVLLLRLCTGIAFALRLRSSALPVASPSASPLATQSPLASQSDIRVSDRIAGPVTIASTIVLPTAYSSWDEATLRVVLTHESAHVRQRDFYVQLVAGLHCALFWFNPFSWWLQRQLSELGEALSDCAAVEHAQSRASYAEILLAFATRGRWPQAGVAMARSSGLTPRIERLLDDQGFEQSFAAQRRLPLVVAAIVTLAMIASTVTVKVRAAAPEPAAPTQPTAEIKSDAGGQPSKAAGPTDDSILSIHSGDSRVVFATGGNLPGLQGDFIASSADNDSVLAMVDSGHSRFIFDHGDPLPSLKGDYIYDRHDGKTYLIQDPGTLAKARDLLAPMQQLSQKQRQLAKEQFQLEKQQAQLGKEQAQLGRQQAQLGKEQAALAKDPKLVKDPDLKQLIVKVDTPEFKQSMAELDKVIRQMDLSHLTVEIDQKALAQLQAHLGEMQARIAAVEAELAVKNLGFTGEQGELGERQGQLGEQQGQLGEQQRELGEQGRKLGERQRLLGEQQSKLFEDARSKLKPIIEQAIREGTAKPVN